MRKLYFYDKALESLGCKNYLLLGKPLTEEDFYAFFKPVKVVNHDKENEYETNPQNYPFTFAELVAEVARLQAEYEAKEYQRDRAVAYPSIQEQLDLLYWDKVNGTDNWEQAIAAVKAEYPKG